MIGLLAAAMLTVGLSLPAHVDGDEVVVGVGFEEDDIGELVVHWNLPGHECQYIAGGCKPGTVKIDPATGNVQGCTAKGTPGTPGFTCKGECVVCSGGIVGGNMCVKKPLATCTGSGGALNRGNSATMNCVVGGAVAGPNGCGRPVPTAYGSDGCKFTQCLL